ncbi:hypothetical protein Tco_0906434 [Tanacetum coccineum]|uniref:Uncharacterized protein n=1 Tax=Tanacetum coccineum TaxID=301880 RepID=A0ABQ5CMM2_9ASTR
MNFSVFNCSKEDSVGKPLYSRFTKTNDFKGVPHPLSEDYTPKPQEEIDESLYVYGKKGPQEPEPSVSDDRSSEYSTCQSNDSARSIGTSSKHSVDLESKISRLPSEVTNVNSVRPRVNTGSFNVNNVRSRTIVRTTEEWLLYAVKGNWGTAVKTSASYNWRKTRPNSNYDSRSNFVKTVYFRDPQGKLKVLNSPCFMVKSWLVQDQTVLGKDYSNLLIADSLLKTIWFINAPCYGNEALASPKQTAFGKDSQFR